MTATDRQLLAAQTELAQLRAITEYADSDLVRLALAAWTARYEAVGWYRAEVLKDLAALASYRVRVPLRRIARTSLENARLYQDLSLCWAENGNDALAERWATEALVQRFKATVLLERAREIAAEERRAWR